MTNIVEIHEDRSQTQSSVNNDLAIRLLFKRYR